MSEENRTDEMDETEVDAHVLKHGADDQPSEADDEVEGHSRAHANDEPMEDGDEAEAHGFRMGANNEPSEDDDDVEGHMRASTPRIDARVDDRVE